MTTNGCTEARFLLQADLDGELDIAGAASLAAHVERCPDCTAEQVALASLSGRLRAELPYHAAPPRLRQSIEAAVAAARVAPAPDQVNAPPRSQTAVRRPWFQLPGTWIDRLIPFGAGVTVAAALALVIVLPRRDDTMDRVVEGHIRALQPGHLMDVVSTDQHTVKPWFDGRLDYAPPVKDLAPQGFPLAGGRLDYLAGRPVAALAYRRAQHVIDLYIWPTTSQIDLRTERGERSGYNYLYWTQAGMVLWAVSDLNEEELSRFAELWRASQ